MFWVFEVPTSHVCPQFSVFIELPAFERIQQFIEHLLRIEQKRQNDLRPAGSDPRVGMV